MGFNMGLKNSIKPSARLKLLEDENKILKVDAQESRDIANRAILDHTISENASISTLEPKASLPDKFDGTRRKFRGFINQLELVSTSSKSEKFRATFGEINHEQVSEARLRALKIGNQPCSIYVAEFRQLTQIEWNDAAFDLILLWSQREIKDALVHFDNLLQSSCYGHGYSD
ncbi:hypothetical protein BASA83_011380 [Batrachochytrium salamandrivorans]|nr:hypothetical protein BASA83_011380 [Batrachochytrium salamandrivorans]